MQLLRVILFPILLVVASIGTVARWLVEFFTPRPSAERPLSPKREKMIPARWLDEVVAQYERDLRAQKLRFDQELERHDREHAKAVRRLEDSRRMLY